MADLSASHINGKTTGIRESVRSGTDCSSENDESTSKSSKNNNGTGNHQPDSSDSPPAHHHNNHNTSNNCNDLNVKVKSGREEPADSGTPNPCDSSMEQSAPAASELTPADDTSSHSPAAEIPANTSAAAPSSSSSPIHTTTGETPAPASTTGSEQVTTASASKSPSADTSASASSSAGTTTKTSGNRMTTGGRRSGGQSVQSGAGKKSVGQRHGHLQSHDHQAGMSSRTSSAAPEMPLRIIVNTEMVGAIIGKSGGTIKEITKDSKARVDVLRKEASGTIEKVINIFGSIDACKIACRKILEVVFDEARNTDKDPDDHPLRILAHNALIGRIIGKSGATIKRVMETTNAKVTISTHLFDPTAYNLPERVITIRSHDLDSVIDAATQIFTKLRSCYESDMQLAVTPSFLPHSGHHPLAPVLIPGSIPGSRGSGSGPSGSSGSGNPFSPTSLYGTSSYLPGAAAAAGPSMLPAYPFLPMPVFNPVTSSTAQPMMPLDAASLKETAVIYIPNSCVGAVIGAGGATIKDMMNASGATIKVAQAPKEPEAAAASGDASAEQQQQVRERKVTVIGTPEAQWKAQMFIFRKVLLDPSVSSLSVSSSSDHVLRVEILVPSSQVGRIIGKNGQTVRELQRLTRAQIKLPEPAEQGSAPPDPDAETPVSIVGDFYSSQNAQRQIRALVSRGQIASSLGASHAAVDLTGMGFQRLDHRRSVPEARSSKGKRSSRHSMKQQTTSQHSSLDDGSGSAGPPVREQEPAAEPDRPE